uniref:ARF7 effector protein C-terminal domain-containing protein n=1 Tax=Clastoptera arizonana TaxID=38151 RepID=A0A1B6CKT2_9HEMI
MDRPNRRQEPSWTLDEMNRAIIDFKQGFSLSEVSEKYNIPRKVLRSHALNENPKFLTKNQENGESQKKKREKIDKRLYDENGIHIETGLDICDCMTKRDCAGCFFPCPDCKSTKCGVECRVNRLWSFDGFEVEELK